MTTAKLRELECHFNWIPDDVYSRDIEKSRDYIKANLKVNTKEDFLYMPILAFLWTKEPNLNLEEALNSAEESVALVQKPDVEEDEYRRKGFKIVALGNLAHVYELLGNEKERDETLQKIEQLEENSLEAEERKKVEGTEKDKKITSQSADKDEKLDANRKTKVESSSASSEAAGDKSLSSEPTDAEKLNKIKAAIVGMKAFVMTEFNVMNECLLYFREAEKLDPDYFRWPLGRGIAAGRLQRRHDKRNENVHLLQQLDMEQSESLEQALVLSKSRNYFILMLLADVYYWRGCGTTKTSKQKDFDMLKKAEMLYLEAYELNPNSSSLLKRIGKSLPEINQAKYESFGKECLLKSLEIEPGNSMALHRLGQFYEHASYKFRDLKKAENCYLQAVTSGPSRNLAAEMDIGRVRKKMNHQFDQNKYYMGLLDFYPEQEHKDVIITRLNKMAMYRRMKTMHL